VKEIGQGPKRIESDISRSPALGGLVSTERIRIHLLHFKALYVYFMEGERSIEFDRPVAQTGKARVSSRFHFKHFKALKSFS
jgi:hypothetical protein